MDSEEALGTVRPPRGGDDDQTRGPLLLAVRATIPLDTNQTRHAPVPAAAASIAAGLGSTPSDLLPRVLCSWVCLSSPDSDAPTSHLSSATLRFRGEHRSTTRPVLALSPQRVELEAQLDRFRVGLDDAGEVAGHWLLNSWGELNAVMGS